MRDMSVSLMQLGARVASTGRCDLPVIISWPGLFEKILPPRSDVPAPDEAVEEATVHVSQGEGRGAPGVELDAVVIVGGV